MGKVHESLPTDVIELKTKNIPPESPENLEIKDVLAKDRKSKTRIFSWDKSTDPDGTVKEYHIYKKTEDDYSRIGSNQGIPRNGVSFFLFKVLVLQKF